MWARVRTFWAGGIISVSVSFSWGAIIETLVVGGWLVLVMIGD
jgi:hypothetical protein